MGQLDIQKLSLEEIGEVLSDDSTPNFESFRFKAYHDKTASPGTIVSVKINDNKFLLGRIISCHENNPHYDPVQLSVKHVLNVETDHPGEEFSFKVFRVYEVEIMDEVHLIEEKPVVRPAEILPKAGSKVVVPPQEFIYTLLGLDTRKEDGFYLGNVATSLGTESQMPVVINKKSIQRHVFIGGTTGSGKSYAAKVLAEEINKQKIPTIFFDTQNEFGSLVEANDGVILRPGKNYFVKLSSLSEDEMLALVPTLKTEHQVSLISTAFLRLKNPAKATQKTLSGDEADPYNFKLKDLLEKIDDIYQDLGIGESTYKTVRQRAEGYISRYDFIGDNFDWTSVLKPGTMVCIDCSKFDRQSLQLILAASLRELQYMRKNKKILPYVMYIDEAHLFVPQSEDSPCQQIIRESVRIGRHYGICMVLITQSPIDIDKKVIRQCNTRLLFAIEPDQLDALQGVKSDATTEMLAKLPKSPVGTCILSGTHEVVKHAIPLKIRQLETKLKSVGGETPDIFSEVNGYGKQ